MHDRTTKGALISGLALIAALMTGCAASDSMSTGPGGDDGDDGAGAAGATTTATGVASTAAGPGAGATGGTTSGGEVTEGTVGMVVIDVQETFVDGAANADMAGILDRTKTAFQRAADAQLPFFVTFEDSQSGDHALHAPLQPMLPAQTQTFIKTTFGATGLSSFAGATQASGVTHFVVVGAETDVCVLQTALGLRALGFTVLLQRDAVFTEETNTSPALRRMQQAGVILVTEGDVAGFVANPHALPVGGTPPVTITAPLSMGVVINDLTDASLGSSGDALKTQKLARLRELLLVAEWFDLPVYVDDVGAGLPSQLAQYFQGQLRPTSQIAQDGAVTQLTFAGTDGGLAGAMTAWQSGHDLFVMEDALLTEGTPDAQRDLLQPFFDEGLVPTTYKSFYYDMTKSVDLGEWPSQTWVQRFDEYYAITQAPEDLPAMPVTN